MLRHNIFSKKVNVKSKSNSEKEQTKRSGKDKECRLLQNGLS